MRGFGDETHDYVKTASATSPGRRGTYEKSPALRVTPTSNGATATTNVTTGTNPRVITIDINIGVNIGRGSETTVGAHNAATALTIPVNATTTVVDNVRNINIDFRVPPNTAVISTDGSERSSRRE